MTRHLTAATLAATAALLLAACGSNAGQVTPNGARRQAGDHHRHELHTSPVGRAATSS